MILLEGKTVFDEKDVASEFNRFFTNVGPNLAKKVKKAQKKFNDYLEMNTKRLKYNLLTENRNVQGSKVPPKTQKYWL